MSDQSDLTFFQTSRNNKLSKLKILNFKYKRGRTINYLWVSLYFREIEHANSMLEPKAKGIEWRSKTDPTEKKFFPTGQSHFLGIGIDRYSHFSKLNNAVRDVQAIALILKRDYDIDHSTLLVNEAASRENIIATFDQLSRELRTADKLLIYYSGHGHLNPDNKLGYWIPADAEKSKTDRYILNSTIRDYINVIKARHTLLISDACFSGSIFYDGTLRDIDTNETVMAELDAKVSRWALCSGRADEKVYDGKPGKHSPFAASILNVLEKNKRSYLNVAYLINEVITATRANYEQLPEGNPLLFAGHAGGQYIFRRKGVDGLNPSSHPKLETEASGQPSPLRSHNESGKLRPAIFSWLSALGIYLTGILVIIFLLGEFGLGGIPQLIMDAGLPFFLLISPFFASYFRPLPARYLRYASLLFGLIYLYFILNLFLISPGSGTNWAAFVFWLLSSILSLIFLLPRINN